MDSSNQCPNNLFSFDVLHAASLASCEWACRATILEAMGQHEQRQSLMVRGDWRSGSVDGLRLFPAIL